MLVYIIGITIVFDSSINDLIVFTYLHTNSYTKHPVSDDTVIIHVALTFLSVVLFPWLLLYCNCDKELTVTNRKSSAKWWLLHINVYERQSRVLRNWQKITTCLDGDNESAKAEWITESWMWRMLWLVLSRKSGEGNTRWKVCLHSHC